MSTEQCCRRMGKNLSEGILQKPCSQIAPWATWGERNIAEMLKPEKTSGECQLWAGANQGPWATGLAILGNVRGKVQPRTRGRDGYDLGVVLENGFDSNCPSDFLFVCFLNSISLCSSV